MAKQDLFKLLSIRAPQAPREKNLERSYARFDKTRKSPLHEKLAALTEPDRRFNAIAVARAHLLSDEYFGRKPASVELAKALVAAVEVSATKESVKLVRGRLKKALEVECGDYLKRPATKKLKEELWDGFYAQFLAPEVAPADRNLIISAIRGLHFLEVIARVEDQETPNPLPFAKLAEVRLIVPKDLISFPEPETLPAPVESSLPQELDALKDRLAGIRGAIDDILNADRVFFKGGGAESPPPATVASSLDEFAEFLKGVKELPEVEADILNRLPTFKSFASRPAPTPWLFAEFGKQRLKPETRELLLQFKTELDAMHAPEAVETLEKTMVREALAFFRPLSMDSLAFISDSDSLQAVLDLVPVPFLKLPAVKTSLAVPTAALPASLMARGMRPLGIGDLLIVQEELLRYETGEVAHIENVLKSESKNRKHRRLRRTEETVTIETEEIEETEKDLQTTERFELQTETQKTIEKDLSFQAGVTVSASYGAVTFGSSADFATSTSQTESNRAAATFAKDVTDRSISRITQRVREERTRKTIEEFEETNEHGFDNRQGAGHVIGVYRWVDKRYRNRVINYGRRLMFEFIVPEPAAFFLHASLAKPAKAANLPLPEKPMVKTGGQERPLQPNDLNSQNFTEFVSKYNVQDVDPFPAAGRTVGMAFAESAGSSGNTPVGKAYKELQVPDGYVALFHSFSYAWTYTDNRQRVDPEVFFGDGTSVTGLDGIIPVSVAAQLNAIAITVTVSCNRKPETLAKWQLKTFQAIMNAYERLLADFNEQLAAAQIQQGTEIQGRNPDFNRRLEREELQKGCLRLLTNDFAQIRVGGEWRTSELFNAMRAPGGAFNYPEFDVGEAITEGKIIQFFEQAFEWNNMTYVFYPYFWGRKDNWLQTFPLDDVDPKFRDFLRAGSARIMVPAHTAYAEAILHFVNTNEIWNGGEPPTLDDPLFISIVEEIKADTGADLGSDMAACSLDSGFPCVVDEWEVKLPTSLVYLQPDAVLPDLSRNRP